MDTNTTDDNSKKVSEQNEVMEGAVAYEKNPESAVIRDELYDEVMKYWPGLTVEKKKAILGLMQVLVEDEKPVFIPAEEWEIMMKEREAYLAGRGKTYTREESREILRNPTKRNALLNNHK